MCEDVKGINCSNQCLLIQRIFEKWNYKNLVLLVKYRKDDKSRKSFNCKKNFGSILS